MAKSTSSHPTTNVNPPSTSIKDNEPPISRCFAFLDENKGTHLATFSTVVFGIFLRWCTALNGYSG
jgi:hypothetical protein